MLPACACLTKFIKMFGTCSIFGDPSLDTAKYCSKIRIRHTGGTGTGFEVSVHIFIIDLTLKSDAPFAGGSKWQEQGNRLYKGRKESGHFLTF